MNKANSVIFNKISITLQIKVAQSVARMVHKPEIPGSIPVRPHNSVPPSADSGRAVLRYGRKYVNLVLVKRLGRQGLPRIKRPSRHRAPDKTGY